jgi:hypothetical protein
MKLKLALLLLLLAPALSLAANGPLRARIFATVVNRILYNNTLANVVWTKTGTTVTDADAANCPLDAQGVRMSLVAGGGSASYPGLVDWTKCADGSTSFACAGTLTPTFPVTGGITYNRANTLTCGSYTAPANTPCVLDASGAVWDANTDARVATQITNPTSWCIGFKAKPTAWSGTQVFWEFGPHTGANSAFVYTYGAALYFQAYDKDAALTFQQSTTVAAGEHDIVFCDNGSRGQTYVDGVQIHDVAFGVGPQNAIGSTLYLGQDSTNANRISGQMSKVCQADDYATVADCLGAGGFPSLLLHMDGSGSTFVDSSIFARTMTPGPSLAQYPVQQGTTVKFGAGAGDMRGDVVSWLSTPASPDLHLMGGDFTIDFQYNPTNVGGYSRSLYTEGITGSFGEIVITRNEQDFIISFGKTSASWHPDFYVPGALTYGVWQHIALTKSGNTIRLFKNGNVIGTYDFTGKTTNYNGTGVVIGGIGASGPAGYMDEFRIVKGAAAWTGAFTAPSAAYTTGAILGVSSVSQDVALTTARSVYLAYPTGGSSCAVIVGSYAAAGEESVTLTPSAVRYSKAVAGQSGIQIRSSTCASWCQSGAMLETSLAVHAYCGPTTSAAVTCKTY